MRPHLATSKMPPDILFCILLALAISFPLFLGIHGFRDRHVPHRPVEGDKHCAPGHRDHGQRTGWRLLLELKSEAVLTRGSV